MALGGDMEGWSNMKSLIPYSNMINIKFKYTIPLINEV